MIEADDEYTGSHSRDVVELVVSRRRRGSASTPREQRMAEFAALLHDVGKVKIPPEIINKPGPLDDEERALMNTHTILGQQMLERDGGLLGEVGPLVRSCHERWDGNGYPDRLAGEEIPLVARIVCACDAWSAMTTDRSYRTRALARRGAWPSCAQCSGTQFDPRVVDALPRGRSLAQQPARTRSRPRSTASGRAPSPGGSRRASRGARSRARARTRRPPSPPPAPGSSR